MRKTTDIAKHTTEYNICRIWFLNDNKKRCYVPNNDFTDDKLDQPTPATSHTTDKNIGVPLIVSVCSAIQGLGYIFHHTLLRCIDLVFCVFARTTFICHLWLLDYQNDPKSSATGQLGEMISSIWFCTYLKKNYNNLLTFSHFQQIFEIDSSKIKQISRLTSQDFPGKALQYILKALGYSQFGVGKWDSHTVYYACLWVTTNVNQNGQCYLKNN